MDATTLLEQLQSGDGRAWPDDGISYARTAGLSTGGLQADHVA